MELPGINPDEVEISVTGDTLTVKGQRKAPEDIKEEEYQLCELTYGSFTRSVTLAQPVNPDKIEAMCDNGILDIYLPKAQAIKPKLIRARRRVSQTQPKMIAEKSSASQSKSQAKKSSSKTKS
jgi:HSP20 family protein